MEDQIARARTQLLDMHLVLSDLRVRYWMTAAIGTVALALCLAGIGWAALAPVGGTRPQDPIEIVALSLAGMIATAWFIVPRLSAVGVLVAAMHQQIARLTEAVTHAEDASLEELRNARDGRTGVAASG